MSDATLAPGILTIDVTTNTSVVNTHNQIVKQVMKLNLVRIEMSSSANALTAGVLYLDAPFLSNQQLIDGIPDRFMLPLPLQNNAVTHYVCDLPVYMSRHIHNSFQVDIRTSTGALATNLVRVTLQFSFDYNFTS